MRREAAWIGAAALAAAGALGLVAAQAQDAPFPERPGLIRRGDRPLTLVGPALRVGAPVPAATLRGPALEPVALRCDDGRVRVVVTVPSLDTPTCSREAIAFEQRAAALGPAVEVVLVSRDLPFAQRRFCGANGVERLRVLSDYEDGRFGRAWGLLIKENALLCRAVAVVDGQGLLRHLEVVEELADEPDYDAALRAAAALVRGS